jgi:DNA-binding ferritin-like protein
MKQTKKNKTSKTNLVCTFLSILNVVKLYHWKTKSYDQHKATDKLYEKLNDHMDSFVEVMLGKDQSRIQFTNKYIPVTDFNTTEEFIKCIQRHRIFLTDLTHSFDPVQDSDLLNIRDEILGDLNQFLYLMSFK